MLHRVRRWLALIAVPAVLFLLLHPFAILLPSEIAWLLDRDAAAHFLGWQFFRQEPILHWPLGWIASLMHPLGTSLGQTDSIPLAAMLLRPISALLPSEAQYMGAWLFGCWIAMFVAAQRLLAPDRKITSAASLLGAALFTTAPALVYRELMRHEALTAHALLLAGFLLYRADWTHAKRPLALTAALFLIAGLIHPYWIIMLAAIQLATIARAHRDQSRRAALHAATALAIGLALAAADIAAVGYLEGAPSDAQGAGGFGECASDVLAFANPMAISTFLRGFEVLPCRHEGFAYLGLGAVALIVVALLMISKRNASAKQIGGVTAWPLWCAALAMWIFALSSNITVAHVEVLDLSKLYALLEPLPSVLRSSGRFVWPLYYLVLWWTIERVLLHRRALAILAACCALQAIDVAPGYHRRISAWTKLTKKDVEHFWPKPPPPNARHLVLYPPTFTGTSCESPVPNAFITFGRLAALHHLTFNGGYTSRPDRAAVRAYCDRLRAELDREEREPDTIYVLTQRPPESFDCLAPHENTWTCFLNGP